MRTVLVKAIRIFVALGVVMLVMRFAGPKIGEFVDRQFEAAPEDFPPKWMYLNISAIREQNERILHLLQEKETVGAA